MNKYTNIINKVEGIVKAVSKDVLLPCLAKVKIQNKADGSLVTQADIDVQNAMQTYLQQHFPNYGFFAEELSQSELTAFFSHNQAGYWCLDPIDGTSNFAATLPYFCISLALIVEHETVLGLIYDPIREECFSAIKGAGAKINNQPIIRPKAPEKLSECIAIIDFKRLSDELAIKLVTQAPYHSQRSLGSVALDWCWLAMGRAHIYLHGKQMLWDYAAGLLIAEETACVAVTLDGESIFTESLEAKTALASIDKNIHKQWLAFVC